MDHDSEIEYCFGVLISCDHVLNEPAAVFTDRKEAEDFKSYVNRQLFNTGSAHIGAVKICQIPFNPLKE